jgi:hypothetical protein
MEEASRTYIKEIHDDQFAQELIRLIRVDDQKAQLLIKLIQIS